MAWNSELSGNECPTGSASLYATYGLGQPGASSQISNCNQQVNHEALR